MDGPAASAGRSFAMTRHHKSTAFVLQAGAPIVNAQEVADCV